MSLRNRIAARILDAVIARIPESPDVHSSDGYTGGVCKYVIRDIASDEPYITRVLFPRIPLLGIRPMLHKIHRPDADRALHNHPWKRACSIVLAGSYTEERLAPDESRLAGKAQSETKLVRWFNFLTDQSFHRIAELQGEVFTLFITGERTQGWGFLDENGEIVPHAEYIACLKASEVLATVEGSELTSLGIAFGVHRFGDLDDEYRARILAIFRGQIH